MLEELVITDLDFQGRGVARLAGKAVFVSGALPTERVKAQIFKDKPRFSEAKMLEFVTPAADRIMPACPYYARCGGCDLQHLALESQRKWKLHWWQQGLQRARIDCVAPELLADEGWGYRARARLVLEKGKIGFRAPLSHELVAIETCLVLEPRLAQLLPELSECAKTLVSNTAITLDAGENALALGVCASISAKDRRILEHFVAEKDLALWVGDAQITDKTLEYHIAPELSLRFTPNDFTQANRGLNQKMVAWVMAQLALEKGDRVADFFAGLGNFSLPLVMRGVQVISIEGVMPMVKRAKAEAQKRALTALWQAERVDLFKITPKTLRALGTFAAWIIDPPRAGAKTLCEALAKLPDALKPKKIAYVSCNPASFTRDAQLLAQAGYRIRAATLVDMFAQTTHIESITLFVKD